MMTIFSAKSADVIMKVVVITVEMIRTMTISLPGNNIIENVANLLTRAIPLATKSRWQPEEKNLVKVRL